ncbi:MULTISPECIES: SUKH-4 family immunity protein [unclassified Micromonospora]|uniref:SUKH-4 family immunity protein n=1 Tax=unclassified Micromonospora TaxID=2617518 RepID=UPI00332B64AE
MIEEKFRYSPEYVECVRDVSARSFLVAVGLPARHDIFTALEMPGEGAALMIEGLEVLKIGVGSESDDVGVYCIDCDTGSVIYVNLHDLESVFVNSSPAIFAHCLAEFDAQVAGAVQGPGETDPEDLAQLLEAGITNIEPMALADDAGFWRSLLNDVAVGDYTDDGGDC